MRLIAFARHVWLQKLTDSLAVGVTIHVLPMKSCSKFAKDAQKTPIPSSDDDHNAKHFSRIEGIKLEDWTL